MQSTCLLRPEDLSRPNKPTWTLWLPPLGIGRGANGAGFVLLFQVFWHPEHRWICCLTSYFINGHHQETVISSCVLSMAMWPAMWLPCASWRMSGRRQWGAGWQNRIPSQEVLAPWGICLELQRKLRAVCGPWTGHNVTLKVVRGSIGLPRPWLASPRGMVRSVSHLLVADAMHTRWQRTHCGCPFGSGWPPGLLWSSEPWWRHRRWGRIDCPGWRRQGPAD